MEQKVAPGSFAYKTLSWDAHTILSPIRDVAVGGNGEIVEFLFGPAYDGRDQAESQAYLVGGMVFRIWNEFAEVFDFEFLACGVSSGAEASNTALNRTSDAAG